MPLIGNVLKTLAKSVVKQLGLTAAASATDAANSLKNVWIWSASFGLSFAYNISNF